MYFLGSMYDENKSTDGADESTASSMGDDLVFNDADKKNGAHHKSIEGKSLRDDRSQSYTFHNTISVFNSHPSSSC